MKRGPIIMIPILIIVLLVGMFIFTYQANVIEYENYDELILMLESDNQENYEVEFLQTGKYAKVSNFSVSKGEINDFRFERLTLDKIKEEVLNKTLKIEMKDSVIKKDFQDAVCFSHLEVNLDNSFPQFTACFNKENKFIYFSGDFPGSYFSYWKIKNFFNENRSLIKEWATDEAQKRWASLKIENCPNKECQEFFEYLNGNYEENYKVIEYYEIKPYNAYTSNYTYKFDFEVKDGEALSVNRLEGVYGRETTEKRIKLDSISFQIGCEIVKEIKEGKECFSLKISSGEFEDKCETTSTHKRDSCEYCFSEEGFLSSNECQGNGIYSWKKTN